MNRKGFSTALAMVLAAGSAQADLAGSALVSSLGVALVRGAQLALNGVEGFVELAAQSLHGGDRGNGDQGRNEAVFDGGGALLVTEQLVEEFHVRSPG